MSSASLADLLANQLPQGLAVRARLLLNTQAAIDRALPAALAGHVRIMQLESSVLSVACDISPRVPLRNGSYCDSTPPMPIVSSPT